MKKETIDLKPTEVDTMMACLFVSMLEHEALGLTERERVDVRDLILKIGSPTDLGKRLRLVTSAPNNPEIKEK